MVISRIQLFLRNKVAGIQTITLIFYSQAGTEMIRSSPSPTFQVANTPNPMIAETFGPTVTDALDIFSTQQYQMMFNIQTNNALSGAQNGQFVVTLPALGFLLTAGQQLCKYSRDNGTHWIRSTACAVSGNVVTVPVLTGFDIQVRDVVLLVISTQSNNVSAAGFVRPTSPQIYNFNVKSQIGTTVLESVFLPLVINPIPVAVTGNWYSRDASAISIAAVTTTYNVNIFAADFFQVEFDTYDNIQQVFADYLGQVVPEQRMIGSCARSPAYPYISDLINLDCYLTPGIGANNPAIKAKLVVFNTKNIAAGTLARIYFAGLQNPAATIPGGFTISVMRRCRADGYACPTFRRRDYAAFSQGAAVTPSGMPPAVVDSSPLFLNSILTTFTVGLTTAVDNHSKLHGI